MFTDNRLGNCRTYSFQRPKGWRMRFPESIRKSVVYCARLTDKGGVETPYFAGTGFIVSVEHYKHQVIVTAKHVAKQLMLGKWFIRMNSVNGFIDLPGSNDCWRFHPTEPDRVDVAVMPWPPGIPDGVLDAGATPIEMFCDDKVIAENDIGPGDELHVPGLFSKMTGSSSLSIVRTGNVAMIPGPNDLVPGVKVNGENSPGVDAEAYLIEARSMGGMRGSPVFVRTTVTTKTKVINSVTNEITDMQVSVPGAYYLLGLMHGHWETIASEKNEPNMRTKDKDEESINTGIAVVIPAKKILEVIRQPELIAMRARADRLLIESQGTTTPD